MRAFIVLLSLSGLATAGFGCKRPARWGSSDAYAAAPGSATTLPDGGVRVQSAPTQAPGARIYPAITAPTAPTLQACIAAYRNAKTADDFGRIADDATCTLSDVALLRWAKLAAPDVAADVLARRRATLGVLRKEETDVDVIAAHVSLARLAHDATALRDALLVAVRTPAIDRIAAFSELQSTPRELRANVLDLIDTSRAVGLWSAAPKRWAAAKLAVPNGANAHEWTNAGQSWFSAGDAEQAESAWTNARKAAKSEGVAAQCHVETARASAYGHRKKIALAAWKMAMAACKQPNPDAMPHADPGLPRIRFNIARALSATGSAREARDAFLSLAHDAATDRLADDAKLKAANLTRDLDGEDAYRAALEQLISGPKEADMRDEAQSLLYVSYARGSQWDKARAVAEGMSISAAGEAVWSGGKTLYFMARADEALGRADAAWGEYARVLQQYPGAYYMRLAATRSLALRPGDARTLWAAKRAADAAPSSTWATPAFVSQPCFGRVVALSEVGETKRATEAAKACAASEPLALGVWYTQLGAFDKARGMARGGFLDPARLPEDSNFLRWGIVFPRAYEPLVREAGLREHVSPALVWGIMREESSFVPDIASPTGALGLMQLMPGTAAEVAKGTPWSSAAASLKTPEENIPLGTKLLGHLARKYAGNEVLVASAYNAGEAATDRWLAKRSSVDFDLWVEETPYDETFGYVRRVASSAAVYRATHLGASLLEDYVLVAPATAVPPASLTTAAMTAP